MTRINGAVRTKYLKGLGMIVFFVALILVQNISGRRDKLRLLDVGRRYAAAKQAIHEAMRTEPLELLIEHGKLVTHGLIDQAKESVDGMVWDAIAREGRVDVLVADPDGDGIDAAAIGLHILRVFRGLRQPKPGATVSTPVLPGLDDEVIALGAATHDIPLTRPIGLLLLRIESSGEFEAIVGDATLLQLLGQPASAQPTCEPLTGPTPDGVIGPLSRVRGALAIGATLLCTTLGKTDAPIQPVKVKRWPSFCRAITDKRGTWLTRRMWPPGCAASTPAKSKATLRSSPFPEQPSLQTEKSLRLAVVRTAAGTRRVVGVVVVLDGTRHALDTVSPFRSRQPLTLRDRARLMTGGVTKPRSDKTEQRSTTYRDPKPGIGHGQILLWKKRSGTVSP